MKVFGMVFVFLLMLSFVSSASLMKNNPVDCPSADDVVFPGQSCVPDDICGDNSGILLCLDTSMIAVPSPTTVSGNYGLLLPGFGVDCYYSGSNCASNIYCQQDSNCQNNGRLTECSDWGVASCSNCLSGYQDCDGDGSGSDGVCEVQTGVTSRGTNVVWAASCGYQCSSGYLDCDGDGSGSDGVCEIQVGVSAFSTPNAVYSTCTSASCASGWMACGGDNATTTGCNTQIDSDCTTVDGKPGTWQSGCVCQELAQKHFITNTLAKGFGDFLLWGKQFNSAGWLMNLTTSSGKSIGIDDSACIVFDDGTWQCSAGGGGYWNLSGGNLYPENLSYKVGIGTSSPNSELEINGSLELYNGSYVGIRHYPINATYNFTVGIRSNNEERRSAEIVFRQSESNYGQVAIRAHAEGAEWANDDFLVTHNSVYSNQIFSPTFYAKSTRSASRSTSLSDGKLTIRSPGDNYILFVDDGAAYRGSIGFLDGSSAFVYNSGGTTLASGIERFRINSNGNVGINKNNPLDKLDINGTIRISGNNNLYFANDGANHITHNAIKVRAALLPASFHEIIMPSAYGSDFIFNHAKGEGGATFKDSVSSTYFRINAVGVQSSWGDVIRFNDSSRSLVFGGVGSDLNHLAVPKTYVIGAKPRSTATSVGRNGGDLIVNGGDGIIDGFDGNVLISTNYGDVGIGTNNPRFKLEVNGGGMYSSAGRVVTDTMHGGMLGKEIFLVLNDTIEQAGGNIILSGMVYGQNLNISLALFSASRINSTKIDLNGMRMDTYVASTIRVTPSDTTMYETAFAW